MANAFNREELARWYNDTEDCVWCALEGKPTAGADCFDHVISRKNRLTNSILNASPTHNQTCNIGEHGKMHTRENQERMIQYNAKRLHKEGYRLKELDMNFLIEHKLLDLIEEIL